MNATVRGRPGGTRLSLYRNPLRLAVSASPWRAAWYLAGYVFVTGWVLFAATFTLTVTAATVAITLTGLPLLVAASAVLRWGADVERARLRQVLTAQARGGYRAVTGTGIMAQVRTRWRDTATWHDVAYLIGLWVPLFILDTVVLSVWLTFLAGVTLPAWYWAPRGNAGLGYTSTTTIHGVTLGYFPHGPNGPGGVGLYVDTLPKALLAAAVFLGRGQGRARWSRPAGPAARPRPGRRQPRRPSYLITGPPPASGSSRARATQRPTRPHHADERP
jgi:hypothetical protein